MQLVRQSKFFLATLGFVAINLALAASIRQLPFMARTAEEKGIVFQASDSAVDDYKQRSQAPAVVLMGSSVMMAPLWSSDAQTFKGVTDVYHHHKSLTLDSLLHISDAARSTFAFALPGAMVSDIYLITDKLLKGQGAPQLIVYGLAPRDFMDDLLTGETRTQVFNRLSDLSDLFTNADLYLSSWSEKADFALNNTVFLYGKRCRYQDKLGHFTDGLLAKLTKAAPVLKQQDVGFAFAQGPGQDRAVMWRKSVEEYRARYRHFNEKQFDKQCQFLSAFLSTAQHRNIKVLLLNMPLTAENIALMPKGFYERYKSSVAIAAQHCGASLLDLQPKALPDACFYDTVHMNASGAKIMLASLSQWIQKNDQASLASLGTLR